MGKYTSGTDAYLSVEKALQHAAIAVNRKLQIQVLCALNPAPYTPHLTSCTPDPALSTRNPTPETQRRKP